MSFYLCVTCLKQCWCQYKFYYSILFIYYLLDNSWLYVPLSSARQNKESEKGLLNTNKQKTNTRTYVNQRDDMITKTRNWTTTEYTLMHSKYIITYECHDNALRMWKVVQLEKYVDFSLLPLTSLLSAPEREVTSPSDFKVVGALRHPNFRRYIVHVVG